MSFSNANFATTYDYTHATIDKRDVSEMLDLLALRDTPLLNRCTWGSDTSANKIEWISEHLGFGIVTCNSAGSAATSLTLTLTAHANAGGLNTAAMEKMLVTGTLVYWFDTTSNQHRTAYVTGVTADTSISLTWFASTSGLSGTVGAYLDATPMYIIGNLALEGSDPRKDKTRTRNVRSNKFAILRQDIRITGSEAATGKHAVANELQHQIEMRGIELKRQMETMLLFSPDSAAHASTTYGRCQGLIGYLNEQSGSHIDTSTATFSESALNTVVAELWQFGSNPNVFMGHPDIVRKFTAWDRSRVRMAPDAKVGGFYVPRYMTDIGIELELIAMRRVPKNFAFVLDTSKIHPRAKSGRKLLLERLGTTGDYIEYQLLSEFSVEVRDYDLGGHGFFSKLEG